MEGHKCVISKSPPFETNFQSLEFCLGHSTLQMESLHWSSVIRVSHCICTCFAATEFETSCKMVTNLPGKPAWEWSTISQRQPRGHMLLPLASEQVMVMMQSDYTFECILTTLNSWVSQRISQRTSNRLSVFLKDSFNYRRSMATNMFPPPLPYYSTL